MSIKVKCLQCGKETEISEYTIDKYGMYANCNECDGSFDIDEKELLNHYTMEIKTCYEITDGYIYDNINELTTNWYDLYSMYEGFEYTIYDKKGNTLIGGAMDKNDIDTIKNWK